MGDVIASKDEGTAKTYPVATAAAWDIAKTVFRWEGADTIEEHRDEGYMLTSSGTNFVSAGTLMGAWVEAAGPSQSKVTVVTKRRVATNLTTTLTEGTFHKRFAQAVGLVQQGKPLPPQRPKD